MHHKLDTHMQRSSAYMLGPQRIGMRLLSKTTSMPLWNIRAQWRGIWLFTRVIVTHAVNPCLFEFHRFDIRSTMGISFIYLCASLIRWRGNWLPYEGHSYSRCLLALVWISSLWHLEHWANITLHQHLFDAIAMLCFNETVGKIDDEAFGYWQV